MAKILVLLLRIGLPIAFAYIVWTLFRTKWAFSIEVDETGVRSHEGISTHQQKRLLNLLEKTRFVEGPMKIKGRYDEKGGLQLRFIGKVWDATRQQIRNFIVNEM